MDSWFVCRCLCACAYVRLWQQQSQPATGTEGEGHLHLKCHESIGESVVVTAAANTATVTRAIVDASQVCVCVWVVVAALTLRAGQTHGLSHEATANSATGTRTRVARVRAEYPNQLDYSGFWLFTKNASCES